MKAGEDASVRSPSLGKNNLAIEGEDTVANILIIDDHACFRELLSEELVAEGYRIATAGDAESAREHLLFSMPDLVLLDIYLDGSAAFGLLENIKRQHPHLAVIIVTAHDSYMEDPRLSRADGYVIKGVRFWDELKQKIAHVLRQKSSPQGFEAKAA